MASRNLMVAAVVGACASIAHAQPIITEIMYDPASGESEWEWIELFNPGDTPYDLDGFRVDRVGDSALSESTPDQIRSTIDLGNRLASNPTTIPAGGVAVLYNGDGLDWDPQRFRDAWPSTPAGATLIGVDGWAGASLANSPAAPEVDESLPGLTFGFWPTWDRYRDDVADLGDSEEPNERVVGVAEASFSFSYDDLDPWPENDGRSSIAYSGSGSPAAGAAWTLSDEDVDGATRSTATFLSEPINGDDFGSPGAAPPGAAPDRLVVTEIMYNPESITGSREWEWIEVYNGGPAVDFAETAYWLDDDDGSELDEPNVSAGSIPSGGVAVLFNASATDVESMAAAWGADLNLIPVDDWSGLNNTGDVVGLWSDQAAYEADFDAGESVAGAVTGVVYDNSSPWPSDNESESIWLENLSRDPLDPDNWSRADGENDDPNAFVAADVFAAGGVVDNSGDDVGSPGVFAGVTVQTLAGDYNGDGRVNAADYTVWRGGGSLLNETVSLGAVDAADYDVWSSALGATSGSFSIPEPSSAVLFSIFAMVGCTRIVSRV